MALFASDADIERQAKTIRTLIVGKERTRVAAILDAEITALDKALVTATGNNALALRTAAMVCRELRPRLVNPEG